MLGVRGVDVDMGESLLEIDSPLDLPQDMLYNRGAAAIAGSFLSAAEDGRSEQVDAQILDELNDVCDIESQTLKHKRRIVDNDGSARGRKSSRGQEDISIGMDDIVTVEGCGESSATLKSPVQRVRPKHLCQECGKTFKRAHNLKIHGRLHSGDKPYGCPFPDCSKEFRWKSSIVSHLNWHRTKKGDVLPGSFSNMHALILKKKKKTVVGLQTPVPQQEVVTEQGSAGVQEENVGDICDAMEKEDEHRTGDEMSEIGQMGEMRSFVTGLTEVGVQYEEDVVEKEEKDDATVLTPSTASYQASPVAMEMGELDCLPVLDEKEWETRSEGCRSGLSGVLLPSLSCCRIENDGDAFGSFLEDN